MAQFEFGVSSQCTATPKFPKQMNTEQIFLGSYIGVKQPVWETRSNICVHGIPIPHLQKIHASSLDDFKLHDFSWKHVAW